MKKAEEERGGQILPDFQMTDTMEGNVEKDSIKSQLTDITLNPKVERFGIKYRKLMKYNCKSCFSPALKINLNIYLQNVK